MHPLIGPGARRGRESQKGRGCAGMGNRFLEGAFGQVQSLRGVFFCSGGWQWNSLGSDKAVFQIVAFKGALNFQRELDILSIEFPKA